jgi:CheY-like chemotaxis protein
MLRLGFRTVLDAQHEVVAEAADGEEALTVVGQHQPDAVLVDVRMPRRDGGEATRRIVASGSRSRVLILTTFDLDLFAAWLPEGATGDSNAQTAERPPSASQARSHASRGSRQRIRARCREAQVIPVARVLEPARSYATPSRRPMAIAMTVWPNASDTAGGADSTFIMTPNWRPPS